MVLKSESAVCLSTHSIGLQWRNILRKKSIIKAGFRQANQQQDVLFFTLFRARLEEMFTKRSRFGGCTQDDAVAVFESHLNGQFFPDHAILPLIGPDRRILSHHDSPDLTVLDFWNQSNGCGTFCIGFRLK